MQQFSHDDVEGFDVLAELALDLYWYWNHSADQIWTQLDPVLFKLTYNPWVVLQTADRFPGAASQGPGRPGLPRKGSGPSAGEA